MPTPRALVKYNLQPAVAVEFCLRFLISTKPFTAKPNTGSGQSILCPPAKLIPASAQIERAPSNTFWATSGDSLSIGHPKMAMANTGFPPMAYTSLMAFADAIRPKS